MLAKLTRGNQVTVPKSIVEKAGLRVGRDYVDVKYVRGIICLMPVDIEERIPNEELEKLVWKALKKEKGDITVAREEAEGFLANRAKRN